MRSIAALRAVALSACLAASLAACSPTLTIKRTQTLADAGTSYVQALQALVTQDRDQYVDVDSGALLARMHALPALERTDPQAVEQRRRASVRKSDARLAPVIEQYDRLLQQLALEQNYFQALQALADDDTNGAASDALASISGAINDVNGLLAKNASPPISDAEKSALSGLAGQVGNFVKARKLAEALHRDAETISEALAWNDSLVASLASDLKAMSDTARDAAYTKTVVDPYADGTVADASAWTAARRTYLTAALDQDVAAEAKAASQKLRIAWEAALSNKLDSATVQAALADVQSLASSLQAIRQAHAPDTS